MYLFLSQKEWGSLKCTVFIIYIDRKLAVIYCLSNSFSSSMLTSKKCWFQLCVLSEYYNYFYRILAAISILSTLLYISRMLKFVAIQFCQRIFFQRVSEHQLPWNKLLIKETIFSEQHQLYWKESSYLKQLFFRRKIFFRILSCLEQLLPSNNFS